MNANEILESFTADYTGIIHHAMRADGQWFTRSRFKDPRFGYRNSAWRKIMSAPEKVRSTGRAARLPKG